MTARDRQTTPAERPASENEVERPKDDGGVNGLSTLSLVGTILAAAFGVQSSKARARDFSQRSAWPFIIGGIIFGIMFVVTLVIVVNMVLPD